jgi:hypothetical protein
MFLKDSVGLQDGCNSERLNAPTFVEFKSMLNDFVLGWGSPILSPAVAVRWWPRCLSLSGGWVVRRVCPEAFFWSTHLMAVTFLRGLLACGVGCPWRLLFIIFVFSASGSFPAFLTASVFYVRMRLIDWSSFPANDACFAFTLKL